ncbi:MAG: TonB-dependent receptor, partial [Bacteroidales bacterium]|nr:TonB-dependent receptor [Bacteroidales bacterium]
LQRGLGTTASGAGAFGASINMNTALSAPEPAFHAELSGGAFHTRTLTAAGSSGRLPSGLYFDIAFSSGATEGYIQNGWVNAASLYAALGWLRGSNSLKLTYLMGKQASGITWTGIPYAYLETDRTYNPEGLYKEDGQEKRYRNHSDNYIQQHLQLNYTRQFTPSLAWSTTADWTPGYGYNERYKRNKALSDYGFPDTFSWNGYTASSEGDIIFRKTMDNDLLVLNSELRYRTPTLTVTGGGYGSLYFGRHYGQVVESKLLGTDFDYADQRRTDEGNPWYFNRSRKGDVNAFLRAEYTPLPWLTAYADLQYRMVSLTMAGVDDEDDLPLDFATRWHFLNPRAGLSAVFGGHKLYASAAYGNREPGRADIKEVIESNNLEGGDRVLRPERMLDIEAGYTYSGRKLDAGINLYLMEYRDMLLETGELSRSGYAIKDNVGRGYRRGVELTAAYRPWNFLSLSGNLTLSRNRLLDYTQYYTEYDNPDEWNFVGQVSQHFDRVDMLLSPSLVGMLQVACTPLRNIARGSLRTTTLSADFKAVGKQYWDNTGSADRCIPAYQVLDLTLSHEFTLPTGQLGLALYAKNVLGNLYYTDAWVYRAHFRDTDSWYQEEGVFPQPPFHLFVKMSYRF